MQLFKHSGVKQKKWEITKCSISKTVYLKWNTVRVVGILKGTTFLKLCVAAHTYHLIDVCMF